MLSIVNKVYNDFLGTLEKNKSRKHNTFKINFHKKK